MLAQILAIAVGFGSFAVYMAAFFFPEVHRKNDFFWSGVGFFYALILWLCAGRITGAVLLGQIASVALLGWFALQTLYLRRAVTPLSQQTPVPPKLQEQASGLFAVEAEEQSVVSTSPFESLSQEIFPSDAVELLPTVEVPAESSQNREESSPVEEPIEEPVEETVSPSPTEVGLEDEPVVEQPETEIALTDEPVVEQPETEIALTDEPIVEQPEAEIEFEDELEVPEELEEKVTEAKIETPPQPKGLSRLLQSITGVFNRKKKTDPAPLSSEETSVEPAAEDQSETLPETSAVEQTAESIDESVDESINKEIDEESSLAEQLESIAVEEAKVIETPETSPETEVEEITVTVEPEVSSSEDQEELTVSAEEPEIIQAQEPTTVETEIETESSSEDNTALKRPNPPDPKLKEAAQKQNSESTES